MTAVARNAAIERVVLNWNLEENEQHYDRNLDPKTIGQHTREYLNSGGGIYRFYSACKTAATVAERVFQKMQKPPISVEHCSKLISMFSGAAALLALPRLPDVLNDAVDAVNQKPSLSGVKAIAEFGAVTGYAVATVAVKNFKYLPQVLVIANTLDFITNVIDLRNAWDVVSIPEFEVAAAAIGVKANEDTSTPAKDLLDSSTIQVKQKTLAAKWSHALLLTAKAVASVAIAVLNYMMLGSPLVLLTLSTVGLVSAVASWYVERMSAWKLPKGDVLRGLLAVELERIQPSAPNPSLV